MFARLASGVYVLGSISYTFYRSYDTASNALKKERIKFKSKQLPYNEEYDIIMKNANTWRHMVESIVWPYHIILPKFILWMNKNE
jgi:hypothetical protein